MRRIEQFQCAAADADERLDVLLAHRLSHLSRMHIAQLLEADACTVNGEPARGGRHVAAGDLVRIEFDEAAQTAMWPEPLPLEIVYEDDELIVVNKPSGLLVHPTRGAKTGTLANALAYHFNRRWLEAAQTRQRASSDQPFIRPGLVHRLDRATSGLMVVTKTQRALSILARHFHERRVEKCYLALVRGRVEPDELVIDAPIARVEGVRPQWRVLEQGKPARTHLRVVKRSPKATLVELEPYTGRTNQLRIHCAHIGHTIIGDVWYSAYGQADSEPVETVLDSAPVRLCLHAARLAFHHPTGGRWCEFVSPLPAEFARTIAALAHAD